MENQIFPVASVHGRFQPLHNQHLEYILEAKRRCGFLWIGITQYNIRELLNISNKPQRSIPLNNPLTYFERIQIIKASLIEKKIKEDTFSFLPFPIEKPFLLQDFLPYDIPIFTTICDKWNEYKINLLESYGYKVIILFERQTNIIRAEKIREQIMENDAAWEKEIPLPAVALVKNCHIKERMERLSVPNP